MIFNLVNGKIYIGQTTKPLYRWRQHIRHAANPNPKKYLIHKAINKYGKNNLEFRIIQSLNIKDEASEAEKYWISFYKSNVYRFGNEFGYNLTDGGETVLGMKHSDVTKNKMSLSHKGIKWSDDARKNFKEANSGDKHWSYDKPLTQEHKEKLSKSLSGLNNPQYGKPLSLETKLKLRNNKLGTKASQDTKDKLSLLMRGEKHHLTTLTDEKVREIKKLLITQKVSEIAKQFNVSKNVIYKIKLKKSWTHIT